VYFIGFRNDYGAKYVTTRTEINYFPPTKAKPGPTSPGPNSQECYRNVKKVTQAGGLFLLFYN